MNLFLMRHAHAVSEYEDVSRPLSPHGHAQVKIVGEHFEDRGLIDAKLTALVAAPTPPAAAASGTAP